MQKTVMVFGGGPNQLTLIKAAKDLGINTIVIDPDHIAPGRTLADHFLVIQPDDYNTTKRAAIDYSVNAIVTSQMENPLQIMSKLADELNFIFPSPIVIERCRNKYLMKRHLVDNNIPCARGVVIDSNRPYPESDIKKLPTPLIIKPLEAHSSRGVFKISRYTEIKKYETEVSSFSRDGKLLVEEYISGREFSVESLVFRGIVNIIQITEKFLTKEPYRVEIGHLQPAQITSSEKRDIQKIINRTIQAFKLDNCSTHIELKLTKSGPVIIEIAARSGGDYISSVLTHSSTGVDMDAALINISFGLTPDLKITSQLHSYIKYFELKPGARVKKIGPWQEILKEKNIVHANIRIQEGQVVPVISDSSKRPGFVLVKGESRNEVIERAEQYTTKLKDYITLT